MPGLNGNGLVMARDGGLIHRKSRGSFAIRASEGVRVELNRPIQTRRTGLDHGIRESVRARDHTIRIRRSKI